MPRHFGYGSNISHTKMESDMRRPMKSGGQDVPANLDPVDFGVLARLDDYRFALTKEGAATIVASIGDYVVGVAYTLTQGQIDRLRKSEGKPEADLGERVELTLLSSHERATALTWKWDESPNDLPNSIEPPQEARKYYLELIVEALKARNISETDPTYLRTYLEPLLFNRKRLKACKPQPKP